MSWATRRKLIYGLITLAVVAIIVGGPVYILFLQGHPTCSDSKQNQGEEGVDCGGPCSKSCVDYVATPPINLWAQAFEVTKGVYNLVAYMENPNVDYVAYPVHYMFTAYDAKGIQIGFREGYASVPATKDFPIFEQSFTTGDSVPAKVFFQYLGAFNWKKYTGVVQPELGVANSRSTDPDTGERIEADVINNTINPFRNVEVVALVYDPSGNVMAASRTYIDTLAGKGTSHVVFTWPTAFASSTSKIEIVPKLPVT